MTRFHVHIHRTLYLIAICFLMMTHTAYASDTYLGLKLGYSHYLPEDMKSNARNSIRLKQGNTTALGGAIGTAYQAIPFLGLRTELEYIYRFPDKRNFNIPRTSVDITSHTALFNIYLDVYVLPFINVYAGAGIGLSILEANLKYNGASSSKLHPDFAAQAGGGLQFIFLKHLVLDLNVRYVYLGEWNRATHIASLGHLKGTISGVETMVSVGYRF